MKKLCSLLVLVMIMSTLSGCLVKITPKESPTPTPESNPVDVTQATATPEADQNEDSDLNIKSLDIKKTLYEEKDVTVYAKSIYVEENKLAIKVAIENNSDKNVTVRVDDSCINDVMVNMYLSCDVSAGKKANDEINIYLDDITMTTITGLGTIDLSFSITDKESYDTICTSDLISLVINEDNKTTEVPSGQVVANKKDIKVTYISSELTEDNDIYIYFYIENNSNKTIYLRSRNFSVNGYSLDESLTAKVLSGKSSLGYIWVYKDDVKENEIEEVESIEFDLEAKEYKSYDDIFTEKNIKLEEQ